MKSTVLPLPAWLNAQEARATIPQKTWNLISHTGSLTEQLRETTNNDIQHKLLSANWGQATLSEQKMLNLSGAERTWIRRIEWHYQETLWVHARVVCPEATLRATGTILPGLGVQSLGEIIFKDPALQRGPFSFSSLTKESPLYPDLTAAIDSTKPVWARRSILYLKEHPILVTEIFTPDMYAY